MTLLRTINALEGFQQGEIRVDGVQLTRDPKAVQAVRLRVGMVFQEFNLFPHLTVLKRIAPCRCGSCAAWPPAEAPRSARCTTCPKVRIPEQADKFPAQLSGGQQQRAY